MSHNRAYAEIGPYHFRTFQVQYENDNGSGRYKSFQTREAADEFFDDLGPTRGTEKRFRRIMQIDHVEVRNENTG